MPSTGSDPRDPRDVRDLETLDPAQLDTRASNSPPPRRAVQWQPGDTLGSYRLEQPLGKGGFGEVWRAVHGDTGRPVALKVLTAGRDASSDAIDRFRREGRLAASLNHPHCVAVFSAEEVDGYPAIAMELVSGGTLQDEIDTSGPVPPGRAVDYILDVIDGLEAAALQGILHRDLKPSNIFVDDQGRAKIGDFGLSKSLAGDASLTATGAYLGTPSFSSPEQVRGRDVDLRSDLYAVGATLYALLAGRPPFQASNAGEVLARILAEEPTPFAKEARIPRALGRVVARCLRKDPAKRFASYAQLRTALLPFSSRQPRVPATIGQRALAGAIDLLLLQLGRELVETLQMSAAVESMRSLLVQKAALGLVLSFGYFVLTEASWLGGGLGKRIMGLRVVAASGVPASVRSVVIRTSVYAALLWLPGLLGLAFTDFAPDSVDDLGVLGLLAMVATMRRRNGHAGLHELASGTRTVAVRERAKLRRPVLEELGGAVAAGTIGPYRIDRTVWQDSARSFVVGHDDVLGRDVWVYRRPEPVDAVGAEPSIHAPSSRQRMVWLHGGVAGEDRWDAYAAPTGTSFVHWVQRQRGLGWTELYPVLTMLADALVCRAASGSHEPLSLRHLWLDGAGELRLVDFPLTAAGSDTDPELEGTGSAVELLRRVARFGLTGRHEVETDRVLDDVAVPESAAPVLRRLLTDPAVALDAVAADFRSLQGGATGVTREQRAWPFLTLAGPWLLLGAVLGALVAYVAVAPESHRDLMRGNDYLEALKAVDDGAPGAAAEREALRMLLAASYRSAVATDLISTSLEKAVEQDLVLIETAVRDHPHPTAQELTAARELVLAAHPDMSSLTLPSLQKVVETASEVIAAMAWLAPFAVALAFVLRGGPLLHAFGIRVQQRGGRRAGRLRCLARAVVAWLPFLAMLVIAQILDEGVARQTAVLALLGLALAGAVYAITHPERGLPDRLVGTRLVPR